MADFQALMGRRGFVKGAGVGLAAMGLASMGLTSCAPKGAGPYNEEGFAKSVHWDSEFDVVVVGFGIAGASSAIAAAREGAKVLLLEKAPESQAGGNSRVCGQRIGTVAPEAREDAIAHCKALRGDFLTPSDEIIEVFVEGLMENESWVTEELGQSDWVTIGTVDFPEYQGAGSIVNKTTMGTKGFNAQTYRAAKRRVESDENITVWYSSAADSLVQNPESGMIHGVTVSIEGGTKRVRARNGVVLCTGGFEASDRMIQDFCLREHMVSAGTAMFNTGDGIRMASECGADLWHLSNIVLDLDILYTGVEAIPFGSQARLAKAGAIFVGLDGTRFFDESTKLRHGKISFHGGSILVPYPQKMFAILDESMMGTKVHPQFSDGHVRELANGTLIKEDTLEGLADRIGVSGEGLARTIENWNASIDAGVDCAFGRDVAGLKKFGDGPYYAFRIAANVVNTMGGPVKNENGEVLGFDGMPIPHLYEAGELGDIWPRDYQGSTNFGGGMIFGRISGKNAAVVKEDSVLGSLVGGEGYIHENEPHKTFESSNGALIGYGDGMGGTPLVVEVVLDETGAYESIEILDHSETAHVCENALEVIPRRIIEANSTDIDCVCGATTTAHAIVAAVNDAVGEEG